MKKLTSERLGRESLAAWEDRKQNSASEITDPKEKDETKEAIDAPVEPEAVRTEAPVEDQEAEIQAGTSCII